MRLSLFLLLLSFFVYSCEEDTPTEESSTVVPSNLSDPGIAKLSQQIEQSPNEADLYAQRASMYYDKKNYDGAINDMMKALSIDSTNIEYHYNLSDVYIDYYRSRLALRTLERAEKLDPERIETHLRLAETYITLTQYDNALRSLNAISRLDPRNPEAFLMLSQVFKSTGDTIRAINSAEEAARIDPDLTDAFIILGQLHASQQSGRAEDYFDAAIAIDSLDVYAIHAKADFVRDKDQLEEAIELYREASRIDRQYVAGYYNAGLLLMELKRYKEAYHEFDLVIKNDPVHIRAFFFRGYANEMLGNLEAARRDYEVALRFAPEYELALQGLQRLQAQDK